MKSLAQFAGHQQIFTDAKILPAFFQTNLVDPARVVKVFQNDPQAEIRIFYYQYLKLCFELENVNYDLYIRKIQDIINNPDFEFIFYGTDDQSTFNDTQAKSLIMEFFGILGEGNLNVLQAITNYPVMDKIFIHFFRSLLILSNITDSLNNFINRDVLLDYLCKMFEVDAEIHGECVRYSETDIFVYEQTPTAVYMAYMDYDNYNNSNLKFGEVPLAAEEPRYDVVENKVTVITSYNQPTKEPPNAKSVKVSNNSLSLAKDSYIASEFMDYTSNAQALTAKAKITLKQSGMDQPNTIIKPEIKKVETVPTHQPAPPIVKEVVTPQPSPVVVREVPTVVTASPAPVITKDIPVISPAPKQVNTLPIQNFNNIAEVQSIGATSKQSEAKSEVIKNDYWQSSASVKPQVSNTVQNNISSQNNLYDSANANKYVGQNDKLERSSPPILANQPVKPIYQPVPTQDFTTSIQSNSLYTNNSGSKAVNKNDIFYSPKNESTNFNLGTFATTKIQETKDIKSVTSYGAPSKKKPFGLNVSEEFTSTDVSKLMAEPHRSNVESMKVRARNFRSSLVNYIK